MKAPVMHDGTKHFDSRRSISRRWYLKCVLAFPAIQARGTQSFHSQGSEAYFQLLYYSKVPIAAGLTAKEYIRKRKALTVDSGDSIDILDRPPPELLARVDAPQPEPSIDADFAGGSSSDDEDVVQARTEAAASHEAPQSAPSAEPVIAPAAEFGDMAGGDERERDIAVPVCVVQPGETKKKSTYAGNTKKKSGAPGE